MPSGPAQAAFSAAGSKNGFGDQWRCSQVFRLRTHLSGRRLRRFGHRVETLVSTYVGALDDEQHIANQRLDTYFDSTAPGISVGP